MGVSVILPTKNEEKAIAFCIEEIKKVFEENKIEGEIIVADYSTDSTPEIAENLGAKVIRADKAGYGYAYKLGFQNAKHETIVMCDADGSYDFREIPKLLNALNDADIVIGSRFLGKIEKGAMKWLHRYIGNPILTWFLNFFFKTNLSDAHSGFRALKKDVIEKMKLLSDGMDFASEMVVQAKRKGLKMVEVPITYRKRIGEAKLRTFSDGWRHVKFMLLHAPTHLYFIPGLTLAIFGAFLILMTFFKVRILYNPGIHTMILGSLLLLCGYNIIFFGLFAAIYGHRRDIVDLNGLVGKIISKLSLERGIAIGLAVLLLGVLYTSYLVLQWANTGFKFLPPAIENFLAFVLLVLGIQTILASFLLSFVSER
ncbi:MAG: glycosyltransferase family 2 protein [Archaeoglobaceae archaeon]